LAKVKLRCIVLFAVGAIFACGGSLAQEAPPLTAVPDCKALQESSARMEATLRSMLAEVRERLGNAERLGKAVGPDASEDALKLLADQERHVSGMLREMKHADCESSPAPR
jgi:hypothetical protein